MEVTPKASKPKKADVSLGLVAELKKKSPKGESEAVGFLGDVDNLSEVTEWIPSGFPQLDRILGGGWAVGRVSEVFGDEASGKSALSHMAIRGCLQIGGIPILLDFENSFEKRVCTQLGINPKKLIYENPSCLEDGCDRVKVTIKYLQAHYPDNPYLIVWDSAAAAIPRCELTAGASDASVGVVARAFSKLCRYLYRNVPKARCHVMFVNQERLQIGGFSRPGMGGPPKATSAGRGIRYAASTRVACARVNTLRRDGNSGPATGYVIKCSTVKNKLAPPHQKSEWILDFERGPSTELTIWHDLKARNLVRVEGQGFYRTSWSPRVRFHKKEFFARMGEPEFRDAALAAHLSTNDSEEIVVDSSDGEE